MKLHLVTYGLGNKFDIRKFKQIKNRMHNKPEGGLWSSPVNASFGWKEWCISESFGSFSSQFKFWIEGNVYVIDNLQDAISMPWHKPHELVECPDFEKMVEMGYDAIYLTEKGQNETRFSNPSLYGWDCECVLVLNSSCVKP